MDLRPQAERFHCLSRNALRSRGPFLACNPMLADALPTCARQRAKPSENSLLIETFLVAKLINFTKKFLRQVGTKCG
jgi:hypothetical protein